MQNYAQLITIIIIARPIYWDVSKMVKGWPSCTCDHLVLQNNWMSSSQGDWILDDIILLKVIGCINK